MATTGGLVARRRGTVEAEEGLQGTSSRQPLLSQTETDHFEDYRGGFLRIRITGYRLLTSAIVLSFGTAKAIQSLGENGSASTWLEWVAGTVFAAFLYWLGFYEAVKPPVLPWFFHEDYAEDILLLFSGSALTGILFYLILFYFMVTFKFFDWTISWVNIDQVAGENTPTIVALVFLFIMTMAYALVFSFIMSLTMGAVGVAIIIVVQTITVFGAAFPRASAVVSLPLERYFGRMVIRAGVHPYLYGGMYFMSGIALSIYLASLTPWISKMFEEGAKIGGRVYL